MAARGGRPTDLYRAAGIAAHSQRSFGDRAHHQRRCRTGAGSGRRDHDDSSHSRQLQGFRGRTVTTATPLLDFFRRGEVARDVRLLAAAGALAPRAHEQLSILILLLEDPDREIRSTAQATIDRIPVDALTAFLARSDVPIGVREFFADRGVFPAEIPAI